MAYKALYRKYRPSSFDSVVGQHAIIKTLQNIVREDKVSHAYLFSGPRGTGKTSIAKIFAKAVNCLDAEGGLPCETRSICKQIQNDEISDIIEIDAASNNGVDEIRDLKSKINLVPTSCNYKVYIIDEVHMLSIGAFNALLKTLEEPPRHVIFILATTEIHKLPLTIISRCQNFNFKKITEEQMQIRLRYIIENEKINIDDSAIYEIARVSDGGMRDAIGLLEQLVSYTNNNITIKDVQQLSSSISREEISKIVADIIDSKVDGIFESVENFYNEGKDFINIAQDIIVFLKDILLYKKATKYFESISTYNMKEFGFLIDKLDEKKIYSFISEINKMVGDLKVSNYPKVIFEINLLRIVDELYGMKETSEGALLNIEKNNKPKAIQEDLIEEKKKEETDEIEATKFHRDQTKEPQKSAAEISELSEEEKVIDENLPFKGLSLYKKIIINNTLAEASKEVLSDLKNKSSQLETLLINKDFKQSATVLMDGEIVGASNANILYVYPYEGMVEKADEILDEIEKLINHITGSKFRIVNITKDNWSEIRPYYVKLMKINKNISILPESNLNATKTPGRRKRVSKEIEEAIDMFGEELIEMKG